MISAITKRRLIVLFIAFGIKLLYDASKMSAATCDTEVVEEAEAAVARN